MEALLPGESREKKRAALLSVGSALLLVSLKAFLVIRTGSLGVLSEALHSGLDLIAAIITFLSIRVSDQPAYERHPYGHGKFENFSTDVGSTIVVIAGICLVWAGERWSVPWLVYADALAGLTVAAVILWVGSRLGRRTLDALLDAAPEGLQEQITRAIGQMDGVLNVQRVRLRRAGNLYFVDATVRVPRTASLELVHAWSDAIEQRVAEIVPSDVVVHAEPRAPKGEPFFDSIRAVAQRSGLA